MKISKKYVNKHISLLNAFSLKPVKRSRFGQKANMGFKHFIGSLMFSSSIYDHINLEH